ncbi:MAG: hypothetical protein MRY83_20265 [Flavobacteriales bacterium]|nr:hypothetical protein [Flavobacteriales bacterium]
MTLGAIIALLLVGLLLVFIEIFIVPGVMKVGIFGLILIVFGVILAFNYQPEVGWYTFIGALLVGAVLTIVALQAKTWERFALNAVIDSSVASNTQLKIGDKGIAIARLAPIGKAKFPNGEVLEVKSEGAFINENQEVEIIKIDGSSITVKLV